MMKKAPEKRIKMIIYLLSEDRHSLDKLSAKSGAPLTELIRRAVKLYVKQEAK